MKDERFWTTDFWQLSADSYNWLSNEGDAYVIFLGGFEDWHVDLGQCVPIAVSSEELKRANSAWIDEKSGYVARYGHDCGVGQVVWRAAGEEGFDLQHADSDKTMFAPIVQFDYVQMEHG